MSDLDTSMDLGELTSLLAMLESCCEGLSRKTETANLSSALDGMQQTIVLCRKKLLSSQSQEKRRNASSSVSVSLSKKRSLKTESLNSKSLEPSLLESTLPSFEDMEDEDLEEEFGQAMGEHGDARGLGGLSSRIRVLPDSRSVSLSPARVGRLRVVSA